MSNALRDRMQRGEALTALALDSEAPMGAVIHTVRRKRAVRTTMTVALGVVAVGSVAVGAQAVADSWSNAPAATSGPDATATTLPSEPAPSQGVDIPGLPTMVPASAELAAQYLDPMEGPAMVTGAMPATAEYGGAADACGEVSEDCDHPIVPGLTSAVLHDADERWAVALYSQAASGDGPGSTGGGLGKGPAGLYLVGPSGQAFFVAAGDPAVGPIDEWATSGLAWAPGRESAVVVGGLYSDGATGAGGFTLVDLLSGRATIIYGECAGVQALATDDGWLLRASCPDGDVAAVVSDEAELVTTDGLLVADDGFAVNVDGSYLVAMHEGDGAASAYGVITPKGGGLIDGDDCYPTDEGGWVVCTEDGALALTEVVDYQVVTYKDDPALVGASSLEICTVGDTQVRRIAVDEPEYFSTILVGDSATPLTPDPLTASQSLGCTSAGGGTGYLSGSGGVWSFDSATLTTTRVLAAPDETYEVTDEWQHPGIRMVAARVVVGGPSYLGIG